MNPALQTSVRGGWLVPVLYAMQMKIILGAILLFGLSIEMWADRETTIARINSVLKDAPAFETFFQEFQSAVVKEDHQAVAGLVSYPLRIHGAGDDKLIESRKEFLARYDECLNENVVQAVISQKFGDLFVNYQGCMIGDGQVWFTAVATEKDKNPFDTSDWKVRISTFNTDA